MSRASERLGLHGVQLAQDVHGAGEVARALTPRAPSGSRRMRTTSARSSSCRETMSLFSSTAGIGSTKRLAPEPEPPWMIPGIWPRCSALSSST